MILGAREDFDHEQQSPEVMLQWFSNPELLNTILTSTSDFLEVIDHVKDKDKGILMLQWVSKPKTLFSGSLE